MSAIEPVRPKQPAKTLIAQMDGSMIPIVQSSPQAKDKRKNKELLWREVRLCLARDRDRVEPYYGATLATAQVAGMLWRQVAQSVGLQCKTRVHGVGDGAQWILEQFKEQFGPQGEFLVDFYHSSEYLGAAAATVHPANPTRWLRRQQGRLLQNKLAPVLESLAAALEPEHATETPVRDAHRYLHKRAKHLNYAGAQKQKLPIGSGEIESGHRHVIQQRLKLSGAWWKESNAEAILSLRVGRANHCWPLYWAQTSAHLQN